MRHQQFYMASVAVAALALATASEAQTVGASQDGSVEEVVVTGSRITRQDYVADSPIITIGQEVVAATGQVTVDRALAQMPQFAAAQGVQQVGDAQAATGFSGGQAYADLRGLGHNRALVLLDGRRLQSSNPDGSVDLNTVPIGLLQNVEVITGGASAVYGSDAVAGVINFKFNPNFTGVQIGAQRGESFRGDAANSRVDLTLGGRFDEGRGHALLSLEYATRDPVPGSSRDFFAQGRPVAVLFTGTIASANNPFRLSAVNSVLAQQGLGPLPGGTNFTGQIGVNPNQSIFTTNYSLSPPVGYSGAGLPLVRQQGTVLQTLLFPFFLLQVPLEKESAFARVNYEVTENLTVFGQAMYTHYLAKDTSSPPNASTLHAISVPVTNPFIPQGLRTILASRPNPNADFLLSKGMAELGPRLESFQYDVYQVLGGVSGKLPVRDWTWEAYGSFGRTTFLNSMLNAGSDVAFRALVTGTSTAPGCTGYGNYNPFGVNIMSDACRRYAGRNLTNTATIFQRDLEASLQGSLLELPAGALKFAAGVDHRATNFDYRPDAGLVVGDIFGFGAVNPTEGRSSVNEAYAELLIPVLRDLPFVEKVNVSLGYRYSDYVRIGGVHTYKGTVDWRVGGGLMLRGGVERAIRAPSVGELFAPRSQGNMQIGAPSSPTAHLFSGDPCSSNSAYFIGPNAAQVRALCAAQGVPAGVLGTPFAETSSTAPGETGGNPDLQPETADTFSIGAVWTSPFDTPLLRNLQGSIDYFSIKIDDAVGAISIADVVSRCFNGDGLSNPSYDPENRYCALIGRDPTTGNFSLVRGLLLNLASYKTSGVDFQLDWNAGLENFGLPDGWGVIRLNTAVSWTPTFELSSFAGNRFVNYAGSIGNASVSPQISHPEWKAVTNLGYRNGPVNLGLTWRYIGKMKDQSVVINPASTIRGVPAYSYFDAQAAWTLTEGLTISGGVRNLADKDPPIVGGVLGFTDASTYDIIGRSYYVAFKAKF